MKKGAALLLAVLLCVLCGCAQPVRARQKTQITLINGWGDSSLDGDRIQELYARFNEENDDIQLNFLTLANTEAVVKVAEDMLVVGRQPDIISVGGGAAEQLYRYIVENGCALDLMPYLQSDPDFTEDAAPLVSSGWATEDGRLYNLSDAAHGLCRDGKRIRTRHRRYGNAQAYQRAADLHARRSPADPDRRREKAAGGRG